METNLLPELKHTADGRLAESVLRKCVHCGFCNATCPTYQVLGDENDGPRGRIYLIKQMLEGKSVEDKTQLHLDRCLTCRNCETTCPSGVEYSKLLDVGRKIAERKIPRSSSDKRFRALLRTALPSPGLFSALLKSGRMVKPLLPERLKSKIPANGKTALKWPEARHERKMLVLDGCVQPALSPETNATTAIVLDKLGISLIKAEQAGCCGSVSLHMSAEREALQAMKRNIDAWWPAIEAGAEAIISTASGCGVTVKEYAHHLRNDPNYAKKSARVSALSKDIAEILVKEELPQTETPKKLAWHPPCTLQHGQKITGMVEHILKKAGHTLVPVVDQHLCCGSAGTYSILQETISKQLRSNKLENLARHQPEMIVTANIGCQTHLQEDSEIPVAHWITLFT